jgi:hypothetical protein
MNYLHAKEMADDFSEISPHFNSNNYYLSVSSSLLFENEKPYFIRLYATLQQRHVGREPVPVDE